MEAGLCPRQTSPPPLFQEMEYLTMVLNQLIPYMTLMQRWVISYCVWGLIKKSSFIKPNIGSFIILLHWNTLSLRQLQSKLQLVFAITCMYAGEWGKVFPWFTIFHFDIQIFKLAILFLFRKKTHDPHLEKSWGKPWWGLLLKSL